MSKIIQAMNRIVENADQISDIQLGVDEELFFKYKNNFIFSFNEHSSDFWFYIYTGDYTIEALATTEAHEWEYISYSVYKRSSFLEKEERDTFNALHQLVKGKLVTKVDSILNSILGV